MKPRLHKAQLSDHPWVVGVATSQTVLEQPAADLRAACDLLEVRVDQLGDRPEARRCAHELANSGLPVLVTLRSAQEGGAFHGSDEDRLTVLSAWAEIASMIDMELSAGPTLLGELRDLTARKNILLLGSFHDFDQTPSNEALEDLIERGNEQGVDAMKLAVTLRGPADLERMEALVVTPRNIPLCIVGMGHLGRESRISLPLAGSCLTYGHLGEANAPGQPEASELVDVLVGTHSGYAAWRGLNL